MASISKPARRTILQAAVALLAASCKPASWLATKAASAQGIKWVAFYGESADEKRLAAYDLVVLDPSFKGSIDTISAAGTRLCGYLSLGEIRTTAPFFASLSSAALLDENPSWPGTHRIDVRDESWSKLVLNEIIPSIAAKGFTGLLLDTLDTPPYLEKLNASAYRGMRQAAVDLVWAIRRSNPGMLTIMNRGYDLLPDVVGALDAVVAESLLTAPVSGGAAQYKWNSDSDIKLQLSLLTPAQQRRRGLPILSLDYWMPDDSQTISQLYSCERRLGHHPYVATRALDIIVPQPERRWMYHHWP